MTNKDASPVRAKLNQDYNVNLRVNIKDQKFNPFPVSTRCSPRNTGEIDNSIDEYLPGLTAQEIKDFSAINDDILNWVKESPKHKALLFENPIEALQASGVKLDRSLLKKLSRIKSENEMRSPIIAGLNINKMEFSVSKSILSKDQSDTNQTKK